MLKTAAEAVEIRDLGEMLAALRQVAQDAAVTEGASQWMERSDQSRDLQITDEGAGRP
jgi:hypothetical protein